MAVSITRRKTGSGSLRYRAQVRVPGHHHVSKTFGRKKAANDWGRQEEDRLRSLMPGSPVNRTVSEAIARYKEEQLPELKSSVPRDRQLDWWDAQVGHLKLFEITPAHIACVCSGITSRVNGLVRQQPSIGITRPLVQSSFRPTRNGTG